MKLEEQEHNKLELLHEKAMRLAAQEELLRMQIGLISKEAKEAVAKREEFVGVLNKKYNLTESQGINLSTGEIVEMNRS